MHQLHDVLMEPQESICLSGSSCEYAGMGGKLTTKIGYQILEDRVRRNDGNEVAKQLSFVIGDDIESESDLTTDDELHNEVMAYLQT
jgi:hypothetical protein